MRISFNTYKPYTYPNKLNNQQQNKQPSFKSGYGAEEFDLIDNPDLPPRSNSERWKNLAKSIKMMTVDQYKYANNIFPEEKPLLYTPEECQRFREAFYEGTEFEGKDPSEFLQPKKEETFDEEDYSIDYSED